MPTKDELEAQARARGLTVDPTDTKETLERKLAAGGPNAADVVQPGLVGQHPESIISDVPDDEKPGPASVMQRETTPRERQEAIGKSALAGPADAR